VFDDSIINLISAYTNTHVPITLCVLSELFQRLDYHLCHVALRGCWHYINPTSLGESCSDKEYFLGYGSRYIRRQSAKGGNCK